MEKTRTRRHYDLRASKPDEVYHVDTSVIRLLNGIHAYLYAVIDNWAPGHHIPNSTARNTAIIPRQHDLENLCVRGATSNNPRNTWS